VTRIVGFTASGWEDYLYWQTQDKRVLKKVNELIKDCQRSPFKGTGKPEPLRGDLAGAWSRRITDEHRLVYTISDKEVRVVACRYHY
jgi:toxin YoeB